MYNIYRAVQKYSYTSFSSLEVVAERDFSTEIYVFLKEQNFGMHVVNIDTNILYKASGKIRLIFR